MKYNKNIGLSANLFMLKNKINNSKNQYIDYESANPFMITNLVYKPKITFVVMGEGNRAYNSLVNQNYVYIKIVKFDQFLFSKAQESDYICFVNGNDFFYINSVYTMVQSLQRDRYDLLYFDEEINDIPFFKPDWSPDTLKSFNYIGSALIKSSLVKPFRDYYRFLQGFYNQDIFVHHISKVLYRSNREIVDNKRVFGEVYGKVSIIIPSKDNFAMLNKCIQSIREKSTYNDYEIIVVDNGSSDTNKPRTIADRYIYDQFEFNFAKMCNMGAEKASGDFLIFLNDDVEVITPHWIELMMSYGNEDRVGAVGAKLLYPDNDAIQHCGVIDIQSGPVHYLNGFSDEEDIYFGRNRYAYNVSAVTAACMLIKRDKFKGFDENLAVGYNDVDLCYKLLDDGYYNVVVNDVKLYHYESASRGDDRQELNKLKRLAVEKEYLYNKHNNFNCNDKYYNVNLTWHRNDFSIDIPKSVIPTKYVEKKYLSCDCKIEYLYKRDGIVYIGGYALVENVKRIYIELDNGDNYIVEANRELRVDLSAVNGKGYALSGYSACIDIRRLVGYSIVNIIVENRFGKLYKCPTDRTVE